MFKLILKCTPVTTYSLVMNLFLHDFIKHKQINSQIPRGQGLQRKEGLYEEVEDTRNSTNRCYYVSSLILVHTAFKVDLWFNQQIFLLMVASKLF